MMEPYLKGIFKEFALKEYSNMSISQVCEVIGQANGDKKHYQMMQVGVITIRSKMIKMVRYLYL